MKLEDIQKDNRQPYDFFDEDGDPTMKLSNTLYDIEHYVNHAIKPYAEQMTPLEIRAMTERLINRIHVTCLTFITGGRP